MRYSGLVHVTDCMDLVVVHMKLDSWDGMSSAPEEIADCTYSLQGIGETDPGLWLWRGLYSLRPGVGQRPTRGSV